MRDALRAGIAIYNAGYYHAAHDAWEDHWLDLATGTDDERLLHGLIQFTAAVYHLTEENWSGASGLAESAGGYLADLPATYRGVALNEVRVALERIATDPESFGPDDAPALSHEGTTIDFEDLGIDATVIAATVIADEEGYDEDAVERAGEYAREEIDADQSGPFTGLVFSFVRDPDHRPIVARRLAEHAQRRQHRESDVDGLFD
jgi:hypothetical protein